MKVLILGHNGMLGHMVHKYYSSKNVEIITTNHKWPSENFKKVINNFDGEFIVNCVGSIHQKTNNFEVNWELPIYLDVHSKSKIIHPGTDCEIDNTMYGLSKRIAKNFILTDSTRTKSITTSIIGPEIYTSFSLMGWFLSNTDGDIVKGYDKFFWNGNTTLTWAIKSYEMIQNWNDFGLDTTLCSECIPKKEILVAINEVFDRNITIISESSVSENKCISEGVKTPHIKSQLKELKEFYYG